MIFVFVLPEFELKHKLKILLFDLYKDTKYEYRNYSPILTDKRNATDILCQRF